MVLAVLIARFEHNLVILLRKTYQDHQSLH